MNAVDIDFQERLTGEIVFIHGIQSR